VELIRIRRLEPDPVDDGVRRLRRGDRAVYAVERALFFSAPFPSNDAIMPERFMDMEVPATAFDVL